MEVRGRKMEDGGSKTDAAGRMSDAAILYPSSSTLHLLFGFFYPPSSILYPLFVVLVFFTQAAAAAAPTDEMPDIDALLPVENRPEDFSGAVGRFRSVMMTAEPTQVTVEEPLILKIRITAANPVLRPPERPDLRQLSEFAEAFYIENQDEPAEEQADPLIYEFVYQMKPRGADVKAVPAFAFHFFDADFLHTGRSASSKGYQTKYADEIPLMVKPRTVAADRSGATPQPPNSLYQLATVPLSSGSQGQPANGWTLLFLVGAAIVVPPVACMIWYVMWRRWYPDLALSARQRRSRAGKRALQALKGIHSQEIRQQAAMAASILAGYLHQRLGTLNGSWDESAIRPTEATATPNEVAGMLVQAGLSEEVANRFAAFLRCCDAIRFAKELPSPREEPVIAAEQLIQAVEAETCSS